MGQTSQGKSLKKEICERKGKRGAAKRRKTQEDSADLMEQKKNGTIRQVACEKKVRRGGTRWKKCPTQKNNTVSLKKRAQQQQLIKEISKGGGLK